VTAKRLDLAHNLLLNSGYTVQKLAYYEDGLWVSAIGRTPFSAQVLDPAQRFSLIESGQIGNSNVMNRVMAEVARRGQDASTKSGTLLSELTMGQRRQA